MPEIVKVKCPENELFRNGNQVVERFRENGFRAYFVGGAVRDLLLNRLPGDIDLVTEALPQDVLRIFPDSELVGVSFGVTLVKYAGMTFEVATCREERLYMDGRRPEEVRFTRDFELDLRRRDFTVNAMLYDPLRGEVLDFNGGLADLQQKIIRVVGVPEERFREDYLRMFRAVRFAAKLGFDLDGSAAEAIRQMNHLCADLAPERVRQELELMLCGEAPAEALRLLKFLGLLAVWLPEVDSLAGVEQHKLYHPEGDVWQHTLLMFEKLNRTADAALAWSVLLHDIGKVPTFSRDSEMIPHFYCHEAVGADMAREVAGRLRFSGELTESVCHAVRNHMRFASVREMRPAKLRRLLAGKYFDMELELHRLDCLCSNNLMDTFNFLQQQRELLAASVELPVPLVSGSDLIALGFKPGPKFKPMLETIMDAQLENKFADKASAVEFVKNTFGSGN